MPHPRTLTELANRKRLRVAGLMSGTSADGIDVAILDITATSHKLLAHADHRYRAAVRTAILRLCDPKTSSVDDICHMNFLLGHLFADALIQTCLQHNLPLRSIDLIGSHGQTIYHIPTPRRTGRVATRSTLQIAEPSVIAERTGITTVADFRPRDIAAGGQGAPLVPFTDYVLFSHKKTCRALQNIGGIANVTYLPPAGRVHDTLAFDSGPGNMVIDALVAILSDGRKKFDRNGAFARKGRVCEPLLTQSLKHPYFHRKPPKTTGREDFGLHYAQDFYHAALAMNLDPHDSVATATALTAQTIAQSYKRFLPAMPDEIILCGGGAKNKTLVHMIQQRLPDTRLLTTTDFGIDSDAKEAVSFAILAWATIKGIPNNVPAATGAQHPAVLGKIIPAGPANHH